MVTGIQNLRQRFQLSLYLLVSVQVKGYNQHQESVYIASNTKNRSQQCLLLRKKPKVKFLISKFHLCKCSTTATQLRYLTTSLSKELLSSTQYKTDSMLLLQYTNGWHHPKTCSHCFCFVPLRVLQTRAHGGTPLTREHNDVSPLVAAPWIKL